MSNKELNLIYIVSERKNDFHIWENSHSYVSNNAFDCSDSAACNPCERGPKQWTLLFSVFKSPEGSPSALHLGNQISNQRPASLQRSISRNRRAPRAISFSVPAVSRQKGRIFRSWVTFPPVRFLQQDLDEAVGGVRRPTGHSGGSPRHRRVRATLSTRQKVRPLFNVSRK